MNGPIVIAGASRSGTAMLRSVLNLNSAVHISGETHYFDDLRARFKDPTEALVNPDDIRTCADYFLALSHRPYGMSGDPQQGSISRQDLVSLARDYGNTPDSYFTAFCVLNARSKGRSVWGEKTPRHIYAIDDIFALYADAKVVCMVRDGRAVVASYRDWKNQGGFDETKDPTIGAALRTDEDRARRSYNLIIASLLWKATVNAAITARQKHGADRVRIQKYEDIVDSPADTIAELCSWIGVDFQESMLNVPMHNSSFSSYANRAGISSEAKERWRKKIGGEELSVMQRVCGATLTQAGYALEQTDPHYSFFVREVCKLPFAFARALLANRHRIGAVIPYIRRRFVLSLGNRSS